MLKPVCVKCKCFYKPKKNDFAFTEGMPLANAYTYTAEEIRGNKHPEFWKPYKCWMGDLWRCPECSHEIIVGVASAPFTEYYKYDFEAIQKRTGADRLQVNDC